MIQIKNPEHDITNMQINEILCQSILTKSKITDWCLNPYLGCRHGCLYCYAQLIIGRWQQPGKIWGTFVEVKINAPEVLERQLKPITSGSIWLSSITDPYQPLEKKYQITRKCLKKLVEAKYLDEISIQTKSSLVARDIDLIKKLPRVLVGMTITTIDDKISKIFEPKSSPPIKRLKTLNKFKKIGIKTYAFVGPLIPGFSDSIEFLSKIFRELENIKVDYVFIDTMNYLNGIIGKKLKKVIKRVKPELLDYYQYAATDEYRDELREKVKSVLKGTNLNHKIVF